MKKKIFLTVLALGLIGAAIGFYLFNKPLESVSSMKTDESISATLLLSSYEEDEQKANSMYLDKVLEVSGKIAKMESKEGTTTIYLNAENDLSNVICQLEKEPAKALKEGDEVTIKGICSGYLMDVVIVRGIVI